MINRNIFIHLPKEMLSAILEQLPNPVYAIRMTIPFCTPTRQPRLY